MTITKIRLIAPGPQNAGKEIVITQLAPHVDNTIELSMSYVDYGSVGSFSEIDHEFSKPNMATKAIEAEQDGMHAIVIKSLGDTALTACREAVRIPVIGLADVSFRFAAMLGRKFGIITYAASHGYQFERLAKLYGVTEQLAGIDFINSHPALDNAKSHNLIENLLLTAATRLIKQNHVDILVLGTSSYPGLAANLQKMLTEKGHLVQVIDPLFLGIHTAKTLAEIGLSHSKILYATPTAAMKIIGYPNINTTPGCKQALPKNE